MLITVYSFEVNILFLILLSVAVYKLLLNTNRVSGLMTNAALIRLLFNVVASVARRYMDGCT